MKRILRDVLLNSLLATGAIPNRFRARILAHVGFTVADDVTIAPGCFFGGTNIKIGARTRINRDCFFDNAERIEIGSDCSIGFQVTFITSSHEIGELQRRAAASAAAPIRIEDGAWLGARTILMPGVTVGRGAVVGAGAVVTQDLDSNGLYVGSPARLVKLLPPLRNRP